MRVLLGIIIAITMCLLPASAGRNSRRFSIDGIMIGDTSMAVTSLYGRPKSTIIPGAMGTNSLIKFCFGENGDYPIVVYKNASVEKVTGARIEIDDRLVGEIGSTRTEMLQSLEKLTWSTENLAECRDEFGTLQIYFDQIGRVKYAILTRNP